MQTVHLQSVHGQFIVCQTYFAWENGLFHKILHRYIRHGNKGITDTRVKLFIIICTCMYSIPEWFSCRWEIQLQNINRPNRTGKLLIREHRRQKCYLVFICFFKVPAWLDQYNNSWSNNADCNTEKDVAELPAQR